MIKLSKAEKESNLMTPSASSFQMSNLVINQNDNRKMRHEGFIYTRASQNFDVVSLTIVTESRSGAEDETSPSSLVIRY